MLISGPGRWAFSAMSALFGGFGIFLLYVAFDDPTELPPALIFLGSALTIVWSIQHSAKASTDHKWARKRKNPCRLTLMLFRVCRDERQARWVVLVEDQLYGEYLDKEEAILDAVEAAQEACAAGGEAEVWDAALRLY